MPTSPTLRRDSLRPRQSSTATTTTSLLKALNLLTLSLAAIKNAGETSSSAATPARAAAIARMTVFIRDAWTQQTLDAELAKADAQLPWHGACDAAVMCVGLWVQGAVKVLRDGGCECDAEDLVKAVEGLEGAAAEGRGGGESAGCGKELRGKVEVRERVRCKVGRSDAYSV